MALQKQTHHAAFDPNDVALRTGTIFGLPFTAQDASVVLIPVPWEVTVSSGTGTANGPAAILEASFQIDLFGEETGDAWRYGIFMLPIPDDVTAQSMRMREKASAIIDALANGADRAGFVSDYTAIERACESLFAWVRTTALAFLEQRKIVGLVGGDHSVSLGLLQAYATVYRNFGVLHIDAHADLRERYEGFTYSHASIMHHALALPQITRLVQVGVRDFCEAEATIIRTHGRIVAFTGQTLSRARFSGTPWDTLCDDIVRQLPENVYISFDIDGLDPSLCPGTGTPVPGGLLFDEAVHLFRKICAQGKRIIGFDLVETGAGTWDGAVGARMLYELCCRSILSIKENT
ncbi:MAG: agmatinase family protein [Desulfobacterota bacterium]|nr:agmatinase family protein [Thermodesulfobacteriota bacterium]